MGKSSAPPVDYAAQAQAQANANKDSASYNSNLNRVDQVTPLGSSTWSIKPGADPNNPQPGDYVQTVAMSPDQKGLYDQGLAGQQILGTGLNTAAQRAVDSLGQPIDTSGLPALQGAPAIQNTAGATAGQGIQTSVAGGGPLATSVDRTGVAPLTNDYAAQRDQVTNAMMARAQPGLDLTRDRTTQSLADKGIDAGSTAYSRGMAEVTTGENDARNAAILAGGTEQSRLANLALATNNQQFGQNAADASLQNSASGQQFGQNLQSAQLNNSGQAQAQGQMSAQDQIINTLLGRNATFNNQARQQGISEDAYQRSLPLNEYNALKSGTSVAQPTFGSYYTGGNAGAAPVMDAALATGAQNQQMTNANNASANATWGAVGTAALTALSFY